MSENARAIETLRRARRRIVEIAAAMQAGGVDTEPLNLPLIQIQEALAELEATDLEAAAARRLEALGRELRSHFNAVRVSGAGLETEDRPDNRLRWLELIDSAADQCIRTVERMDPLFPSSGD